MSDQPTETATVIKAVNAKLSAFAVSKNVEYLTRPTVSAALSIWAGEQPDGKDAIGVTEKSMQECDGVVAMFGIVKEFETFSNLLDMKAMIECIRGKKIALEDDYLIKTFGEEFCHRNQILSVTSTVTSTPKKTPSFAMLANAVSQFMVKTPNTAPPPPPPTPSTVPPLPPQTPPTMTPGVTATPGTMATPGSVATVHSLASDYSRPDSVYGEIRAISFMDEETKTVTPTHSAAAAPVLKFESPAAAVTNTSATVQAAIASPPRPAVSVAVGSPAPTQTKTKPAPTHEGGLNWLSYLPVIAFVVILYLQAQIKHTDLTAGLTWVGKHNASGLIMRQVELVEEAHTAILNSNGWEVLRKEAKNLTVETLTVGAKGSTTKYTKISAIFSASPEKLMKSFDGFAAFDATHKEVLPFYEGGEFLMSSLFSKITLMKATTKSPLPGIPGIETTFAVVKRKARKAMKLDYVHMHPKNTFVLPSPVVIPSGTQMVTIVTVNANSTAFAAPPKKSTTTASSNADAMHPLVARCDAYGRLLLANNSTLCSSVVKAVSSIESPEYYAVKIFKAVRGSTRKMCGKDALCDQVVRKIFKFGKRAVQGVVRVVQPLPVKTRVDGVYWFIPLPDGGTLMVIVSQGLNDMLSQSMAMAYVKTLGK